MFGVGRKDDGVAARLCPCFCKRDAIFGKICIFAKNRLLCRKISSFYGIIIFMNFTDHSPAHFHAWYGDYKVIVGIRDGVVTGKMPGRALQMILKWLDLHRDELISDWEKAQNGSPLDKIEPLN